MKKKNLLVGLLLVVLINLTACGNNIANEDSIKFKEEYESLNGKIGNNEKIYRSITINENNPIVYINAEELIKKMDNEENFYVYFGSEYCPWCRSVIEKAISIADEKKIDKIYYVDIWDDEGNEILRDKYIIGSDNKLKQTIKGTNEYYELLKRFDNLLTNYTLEDKEGNQVDVGVKRIFAPSFIYINKGKAIKLVSGISNKQNDSREDLTKEMLEDETIIFNEFFK